MKDSKKKSFDSLEDAYLEAMEKTEPSREKGAPPELGTAPAGDREGDATNLLAAADSPFANVKGWQDKELLLSADHMTLTLVLNEGGDLISVDRIELALQKFGIVHGIDKEAMNQAETLSRISQAQRIVIGRGTPPQWKSCCAFSFTAQPRKAIAVLPRLGEGLPLDPTELKEVFAAPDLPSIQAVSLHVKAVNPGEVFLNLLKFPEAKPGTDLYGKKVECTDAPLPEAGENVQFDNKKEGYEATLYGYLHVAANVVSVIPPVWVRPDREAAYYIFLPQIPPFRYPTASEVRHIFLHQGVDEKCIKTEIVEKLVGQMAAGLAIPRAIKLAETLQPRHGRNADFTLFVDAEKKAGKLRANGSIDLRERNAVVSMPAGSLIGEKSLATKGEDGCTLFGKKIKANPGADKPVTPGQGVKIIKRDDRIQFFADRDGNVKFTSNTLSVSDIHEISGNIDYNSGNIDIKTDLLINGSVLGGFSVKSEGDICVLDSIENGASVTAQGNITVEKGILGEGTRVVARGNVAAGFIQDAQVIARGDVMVKSYLFNAMLIANGPITVLKDKSSKSGSVAGGMICSSRGIKLSVIGSPGNPQTIVAVRTDPAVNAKLKKLEDEKLLCGENIAKISHSLPFDVFDANAIKTMLTGLPSGKREKIVMLLTNLNKLIKHQKTLQENIDLIRANVAAVLTNARIQVTEKIYSGSEIHIGDKKLIITEEMGPSLFRLRDEQIVRN